MISEVQSGQGTMWAELPMHDGKGSERVWDPYLDVDSRNLNACDSRVQLDQVLLRQAVDVLLCAHVFFGVPCVWALDQCSGNRGPLPASKSVSDSMKLAFN